MLTGKTWQSPAKTIATATLSLRLCSLACPCVDLPKCNQNAINLETRDFRRAGDGQTEADAGGIKAAVIETGARRRALWRTQPTSPPSFKDSHRRVIGKYVVSDILNPVLPFADFLSNCEYGKQKRRS
jgi:hypothetical protein